MVPDYSRLSYLSPENKEVSMAYTQTANKVFEDIEDAGGESND